VREKLIKCRSRKDCASAGTDALCVLTGLTGNDIRGNTKMGSYCSVPGKPVPGWEKQDEEHARAHAPVSDGIYVRPPVTEGDLLDVVRSARATAPRP
jgi:hypothetical protein